MIALTRIPTMKVTVVADPHGAVKVILRRPRSDTGVWRRVGSLYCDRHTWDKLLGPHFALIADIELVEFTPTA